MFAHVTKECQWDFHLALHICFIRLGKCSVCLTCCVTCLLVEEKLREHNCFMWLISLSLSRLLRFIEFAPRSQELKGTSSSFHQSRSWGLVSRFFHLEPSSTNTLCSPWNLLAIDKLLFRFTVFFTWWPFISYINHFFCDWGKIFATETFCDAILGMWWQLFFFFFFSLQQARIQTAAS